MERLSKLRRVVITKGKKDVRDSLYHNRSDKLFPILATALAVSLLRKPEGCPAEICSKISSFNGKEIFVHKLNADKPITVFVNGIRVHDFLISRKCLKYSLIILGDEVINSSCPEDIVCVKYYTNYGCIIN